MFIRMAFFVLLFLSARMGWGGERNRLQDERILQLEREERALAETCRKNIDKIDEERGKEINALLVEAHKWNVRINNRKRNHALQIRRHFDDLRAVSEAYGKNVDDLSRRRAAAEKSFDRRFGALQEQEKKLGDLEAIVGAGPGDLSKVLREKWNALIKDKETQEKEFDAEKAKLLETYFAGVNKARAGFEEHLSQLDRELTELIRGAQSAHKRAADALKVRLADLRETPKEQLNAQTRALGLELKEESERETMDKGLRFLPWTYLLGAGGLHFSLELGGDLVVRDSSGEAAPYWLKRILNGYFIENTAIKMDGARPIAMFDGKAIRLLFWRIDEKGRRTDLSKATRHYVDQKWIETFIRSIEDPKQEDLLLIAGVSARFTPYRLLPEGGRAELVKGGELRKLVVDYVTVIACRNWPEIKKYRSSADYLLRRQGNRIADVNGVYEMQWQYFTKDKVTKDWGKIVADQQEEKLAYELSVTLGDPRPIPAAAKHWLRLSADEAVKLVPDTLADSTAIIPAVPKSGTIVPYPPKKPTPAMSDPPAVSSRFPQTAAVPASCRGYALRWEREGELSVSEPKGKDPLFTLLGIEKTEREIACTDSAIAYIGNGLEKGKGFKTDLVKDPPPALIVPELSDTEHRVVALNYGKRPLFVINVKNKTLIRVLLPSFGPLDRIEPYSEKKDSNALSFRATGACEASAAARKDGSFEVIVSADGETITVIHCPRR